MVRGKEGMSPTPNAPSLVEAMRTLYSPSVPEEPSPDVEMAVDEPVVEEVSFTTVTAKKHKGKDKVLPSTNPQSPPQNAPPPSAVVSRAPPLQPAKKAATKPTHVKVATIPQAPKQVPRSFAQVARSGNPQGLFQPLLIQSMRASFVFVICFQTFPWRRFWLCTSLDLVQVPLLAEEALLTLVP